MPEHTDMTIFFAEVSKNLQSQKENLIQELSNSGFRILQTSAEDNAIDQVRQVIEQCDAAIHILSDGDFGHNDTGKGMEELQISCAVQNYLSRKLLSDSLESDFKIYAWHQKAPSENIFQEEKMPAHLNKIQQLDEVDLLRTNFEEFKTYLLNKIENVSSSAVDEFYIKGSDTSSIYFLYDSVDEGRAKNYIEYLNKRGYTVFTPEFGSDILTFRQKHTDALKKFDIAIIYASEAGSNWINMKVMDIMKSPGLGREQKIKGKAIIMSEVKKTSLTPASGGFEILDLESGTAESQLDGFLQKLST